MFFCWNWGSTKEPLSEGRLKNGPKDVSHTPPIAREVVKVKGLLIVGTGERQEVRGTESGQDDGLRESGPRGDFEKL